MCAPPPTTAPSLPRAWPSPRGGTNWGRSPTAALPRSCARGCPPPCTGSRRAGCVALASCGDRLEPEPDAAAAVDLGALRTGELAVTTSGETCVEPWGLVGRWALGAIHWGVVQD